MKVTTAEISRGVSLTSGEVWILAIETDRKPLQRGGLGRGKKSGSLVANSLPQLFQQVTDYMAQEGLDDLDDLASAIRAEVKE